MAKKFCVIGDKANNKELNRNWFETVEEAEAHAKKLMRDRLKGRFYDSNHPICTPELLVVEVRRVVGVETAPVKSWDANEYDFGNQ